MIAIVLIIVLVVLFFSLRFLIKDMRKNYNAMDENIKSIENKMAELRTVEDCTQLQKEIIPKMQSLPQSAKDIIMSRENKVIDYTSQMLIINPDGRADSWVPSVSDVFAEDWEIVI